MVRYNGPRDTRGFGIYRFWLSGKNYDYWDTRQTGSNKPVDITFLYNNRPIYEAGGMYAGSPFHSNYSAPINSGTIDYRLEFMDDDQVMDSERAILASTGNLGGDNVGIKEQFNYELVKAIKQVYPRRRFIHLYANGTEQNPKKIYEDSEKPNKAYIERWFSDDPDGDFYKIDDWFEFDLEESSRGNINATLQAFRTDAPDGDGQVLKLGRYRWNWQKRGVENFRNNDYTNFFDLVETVNIADQATYTARVTESIDLEGFAGIIAMNHFICNWDTYGYSRGKNMYLYDSRDGWSLVAWDLDFQFQEQYLALPMNPYNGSFPVDDPTMRTFLQNPVVNRVYWRAVMDVMAASQDAAIRASIRARYDALQADFTSLTGDYNAHFNLVNQRYANVQAEFNSVNPGSFAVTSPAAEISYAGENVISVGGIAPFQAVSVLVDGVETPVTWTTPTMWSAEVVLNNGTNSFTFAALDRDGAMVNGGAVVRHVVYTGPPLDSMEDFLVISEIMALPVTNDAEYVEIYNRSATTVMNLSGLYVEGSVAFTFPHGTHLEPGEAVLLVEDPEVFAAVYPASAVDRVAGKYSGRLFPAGGTVILKRPASGFELSDVVIDRVDYGSAFPWPAVTVPGAALQLGNPAIESGRAANWTISTNDYLAVTNTAVDWSASWRYYITADPGTEWRATNFNDSAWLSGAGPLGWESAVLPIPLGTTLAPSGRLAHYFRSAFDYSGSPEGVRLLLTHMIDDGAVFYLNGSEIYRSPLMPLGEVTDATAAITHVGDAAVSQVFEITSHQLKAGENVLAVSVHQNTVNSSDLVFGMKLDLVSSVAGGSSPGEVNVVPNRLAALPELWLNEIQTRNLSGPLDDEGEHEPWVELYNGEAVAVSVAGWRLVTAEGDPGWSFPAGTEVPGGGFLRVWLDGEVPAEQDPANLHAGFRFDYASGTLFLLNGEDTVVDFIVIESLGEDTPYGCWPDGNYHGRRELNPPTPEAANRIDKRAVCIVINEFMADNGLFTNPLSGDQDDWFELFNDGTEAVNLEGWMITDTLSGAVPPVPDPLKTYTVPAGIVLAPGEALRIWTGADNAGSLPFDPANLQAPFGLGKNGDSIHLFNAATSLVDSVSYAVEDDDDESIGRWVNGERGEWIVFDDPTPGLPNRNPLFGTGYIAQPASMSIPEGVLLVYTNRFDTAPPAGFEFRLFNANGGALPDGMEFDVHTGVLHWTPGEAHGPGVFEFDLVGYLVQGVNITACDHLLQTIAGEERPAGPRLGPVPAVNVDEGALVQFTVEVQRDVEIPYYETFTSLRLEGDVPSNAVIDAQSGVFSWPTGETDGSSVRHITIVAEDSVYPEIRCETVVTVSVNEVNSSFTYVSPTAFYLWNNEDFEVQLEFDDPDIPPDDFSFVKILGPEDCTIDSDTGVLRWQPAPGYAGSQSVRFRAYDNAGATKLITVYLYVSSLQFLAGQLTVQPDGSIRLEWMTKPDTVYLVEWCSSLETGAWQVVNADSPVPGTGGQVFCLVDPVVLGSPEKAFFRLRQIR